MNIPQIQTGTSAMTTGEALWKLAYRHTEAYWSGCVRGEWGKKPGQCRECDIFRAALGSDWASEAQGTSKHGILAFAY